MPWCLLLRLSFRDLLPCLRRFLWTLCRLEMRSRSLLCKIWPVLIWHLRRRPEVSWWNFRCREGRSQLLLFSFLSVRALHHAHGLGLTYLDGFHLSFTFQPLLSSGLVPYDQLHPIFQKQTWDDFCLLCQPQGLHMFHFSFFEAVFSLFPSGNKSQGQLIVRKYRKWQEWCRSAYCNSQICRGRTIILSMKIDH